jgi:MFS family permease
MYIIGLVLSPIYKRWPRLRNRSAYVGLPIIALSLIAASFANSVWQLMLTQGILYGFGGSIIYYPTLLLLDEWFIRKKGFAFGVMWVSAILKYYLTVHPFEFVQRLEQALLVSSSHSL